MPTISYPSAESLRRRALNFFYLILLLDLLNNSQPIIAQTIGLQVADSHQVLFGDNTSGAGTKLMWLPVKKSFLAGEVTGGEWNSDSIGTYNTVFGLDNKGQGHYAIVNGATNTIGKDAAFTMLNGFSNTLSESTIFTTLNGEDNAVGEFALYSTLNGLRNTIGKDASYSLVNGENNIVGEFADYITLNGIANKANSSFETLFGRYADTTAVSNFLGAWDGNHQLFAIGNGTSISNRNNAVTVLKNGNVGINTAHPGQLLTISHPNNPVLRLDRSDPTRFDFEIAMDGADLIFRGGKDGIGSSLDTLVRIAENGDISSVGNITSDADIIADRLQVVDNIDGSDWIMRVDNVDDLQFRFENILKSWIDDTDGSYITNPPSSFKRNAKSLDKVLHKLSVLNPLVFYDHTKSKRQSLGFIAEDVVKVFPELVKEKNGIKALAYDDFAILSIKAIQEQQEIIDVQQQELQEVKSQNDELIERIVRLEQLILTRE